MSRSIPVGIFCLLMAVSAFADSTGQESTVPSPSTPPPSQFNIGDYSLGMSIASVLKLTKSPGQTGPYADDGTYHAYNIADHGNVVGRLAVISASFRPDYVYGLQIIGDAKVNMPPFLGLHLGDTEQKVLENVGKPTSTSQVAGLDRTLWHYQGRNYSFEIDKSGHLASIIIYGYDGVMTALGWQANWERYKPDSIANIIAADRSLWSQSDIHAAGAGIPFRPRVIYTGKVQATSPDMLDTLESWGKAFPGNLKPGMYAQSIKVMENGHAYWLPVQNGVLDQMRKQLSPGDAVDLFAIRVGAEKNGAVKTVIVNEFCSCDWGKH